MENDTAGAIFFKEANGGVDGTDDIVVGRAYVGPVISIMLDRDAREVFLVFGALEESDERTGTDPMSSSFTL
jgi:hypothetical protein